MNMNKPALAFLTAMVPLGAFTTAHAAPPTLSVTSNGPVAPGSFIGTMGKPGNSAICYNVVLDNAGGYIYSAGGGSTTPLWRAVTPAGLIADKSNPGWVFRDETYGSKYTLSGTFNGHDVDILPNGHALVLAGESRSVDMSQYFPYGRPDAVLSSAVIQEIDANGNVVFQWRALDYLPITDSLADVDIAAVDLNHVNTIALDPLDNNFLISLRTMCQIVKISRTTGQVIWRLGGKHSDFTFIGEHPENAPYYFMGEHQMHRLINGNLLFFDNGTIQITGTNTPTPRSYSRAVEYHLDEVNMTATLVWEYRHSPDIQTPSEGSVQRFRNGNTLVGWFSAAGSDASKPILTEVNAQKEVMFELTAPLFKAQSILIKKVWNSPDLIHSDAYQDVTTGQTCSPTNSGVAVMVNSLSGTTPNQLVVQRHDDAVRVPKFPGKAPQVLMQHVTLAGTNISALAADISFDLPPNDFCFDTPLYKDPATVTVYQRVTEASVFAALPTTYDPATKKVSVSATQMGEFIFTYPDLPEIPLPPILFGQGMLGTVNQAQPVVLQWTPKGFVSSYQLQVATDSGFTSPVVDQSGLKVMTYTLASVTASTKYYWRVRVANDGGTGDWATASFVTVPAMTLVKAPNGGEGWVQGVKYFIRWNDNVSENVTLDLYKGGTFLKTIVTTANANAYEWECDLTVASGNDYSVRVRSSTNAAVYDESDAPFAIVASGDPATNQAPVFSGYTVSATSGQSLSVNPAKILTRTSDPDGDTVSLTRVFGPSPHGGTVAMADYITYTPPSDFAGDDAFDVGLADVHGAKTRATIMVTVTPATTGTGRNLTSFAIQDGKAEMVFRGIPGRTYVIQRSADLANWIDLGTTTAGVDGKITFTDSAPPVPSGFYRTQAD